MAKARKIIEVDGEEVSISSPDKVYFPQVGLTKLDLIHYYLKVADGALRVGTLETWLVARWGGPLESDLSMAARTLLVDVARGDWSDELLDAFGVPGEALARVVDTAPRQVELDGGLVLTASVADQGSGLVAAVGAPEAVLELDPEDDPGAGY